MRVLGRLRDEFGQGEPELRRRLERRQAERVDEHQPAEPVAVVAGEAGRDGAAERIARPARAATCRCARSARRAMRARDRRRAGRRSPPRRRGPAGRGRSRDGSSTRSGITRIQLAAYSPGPCSRTTGGPSPPSSTAVEMPASCSRRSVTGIPASSRSRASSPAGGRLRCLRCVLVVCAGSRPWPASSLRLRCRSAIDATTAGPGCASGEPPNLRQAAAWVVSPSVRGQTGQMSLCW